MTYTEEYREHIEYTFHAYCKIVIYHSAIDAARQRHRRCEKEISLEYLTEEKHYPLSTIDEYFTLPEQEKYSLHLCGQEVLFSHPQLAAALSRLPERKREMLYLRFFHNYTYKQIGRRYGSSRCTVSKNIKNTLCQLQEEMEVLAYEKCQSSPL